MAKALSKSQIAAEVAGKSGITKKQAVEILDHIAQLAYKNAKNSFTLPGLGKLVLVNRKARTGRPLFHDNWRRGLWRARQLLRREALSRGTGSPFPVALGLRRRAAPGRPGPKRRR